LLAETQLQGRPDDFPDPPNPLRSMNQAGAKFKMGEDALHLLTIPKECLYARHDTSRSPIRRLPSHASNTTQSRTSNIPLIGNMAKPFFSIKAEQSWWSSFAPRLLVSFRSCRGLADHRLSVSRRCSETNTRTGQRAREGPFRVAGQEVLRSVSSYACRGAFIARLHVRRR